MPDAGNTKISIINKALAHIKVDGITSIDESSEAAKKANQFYDCVRRSSLRACDWRFATRKMPLQLLGSVEQATAYPNDLSKQDVVPPWLYTYAYPGDDCIRLRKVFGANTSGYSAPWESQHRIGSSVEKRERVELFEVSRSPVTNVLAVSCNLPLAWAEITENITDESQFDDMFQDAMAWALAEELCIPLTGDIELKRDVERNAKESFEEAKRKNGGEGVEMAVRQSNYEIARG